MNLTVLECWLRLARASIRGDAAARLMSTLPMAPDDEGDCLERIADARLDSTSRQRLLDGALIADVERARSWLDAGGAMITLKDARYPALLADIPDPPPVLFLRGSAAALGGAQLAIVGSRNPSHAGSDTAFDFAASLSRIGFSIASGLARGIDTAAHRGALHAAGITVAVMGNGPDRIYPEANRALAERIVESGGALVTEFFPGDPPRPAHFPRRNRIISGLSLGTLVVEAAVRSGSLITARCAVEQGREVFAVPGSIHQPASRGCHRLIRQGARLVERVEDVVEEFEWLAERRPAGITETGAAAATEDIGEDLLRVYRCVTHDPADIDTLAGRCGLEPSRILADLLTLELRGLVCKSAGFFTRRVPGSRS
jgi:DNA processing protein